MSKRKPSGSAFGYHPRLTKQHRTAFRKASEALESVVDRIHGEIEGRAKVQLADLIDAFFANHDQSLQDIASTLRSEGEDEIQQAKEDA